MNKTKIYIAAALFLSLTAVKFLLPSSASNVREMIMPVIEYNIDYRAIMTELGSSLPGSENALLTLFSFRENADAGPQPAKSDSSAAPGERYQPTTIAKIRERSVKKPASTPAETTAPETAKEPEEDEESSRLQEAIAVFKASQQEFADLSEPANVTYAATPLPFSYHSPVEGLTSSGFGYRLHPILDEVKFHFGTDFAAYSGTDIYAFAAGTVITASENDSHGKYVIIEHSDGYQTLYAHCSVVYVSDGEQVEIGQKIALVGETGQATGPHLHFELMKNELYLNPEFYLFTA